MATYAKGTSVSTEKTLSEIRSTLKRYEATSFVMMEEEKQVIVAFEMENRRVRFVLPLPIRNNFRVKVNGSSTRIGTKEEYERSIRECYRALLLTIKAKLQSVESGIETMDEAFMAQLVLASGQTMSEWAKPQIERLYGSNQQMPPLLGSGSN